MQTSEIKFVQSLENWLEKVTQSLALYHIYGIFSLKC